MEQIELDKLNVLVVEDSPTQALLLKDSLENEQVKATIAKDGQEALEIMQKNLPQLVITDIEMPRMNGYDLCKYMKSDSTLKDIPVILLTGLKDPMDVIRGIECAADSFLTKPCDTDFLLATIKDIIANKKMRHELPVGRKMDFFFGGQRHLLETDQLKLTDLLLSTFSNAMHKNLELEGAHHKLNELYEELKEKNEELRHLNEVKNQFLGMAAHDLRNPLAVIKGYSDWLINDLKDLNEKQLKSLERIQQSSAFMLQLINDLLDISVIESGIVSLHLAEVDLETLIKDNIPFLKNLAEKKHIELNFITEGPIPKVQCDANKIQQVLNNLVSNAIKFSSQNGQIQVLLKKAPDGVILKVKDHGRGISPEAQKSLFQPFSKISSPGTAGEKGTGLGLAIVQKVVQEHKGKIWVESEEGKGSEFTVLIPVTIGEPCKN